MKLLLTSNGVCNQSLADALSEMVGKQPKDIKIGFIPTAADIDVGNKDWYIKQFTDLQKFGFEQIDIVEIAAEFVDWQGKLADRDVVYAGGGNPYYLLAMMRRIKFDEWLKPELDKKIYVGGSSGSIVMTPSINVAKIKSYGSENVPDLDDLSAFGLVDFEVGPHIPDWPSQEEATEYAKTTSNKFYAIDNESGVQVLDDKVKIISEGKWKEYA